LKALPVSAAVTIPATDLSARSVRSSGPGGQNVNKVSSKVELRFDLAGTQALDEGQKARLRALAASRLDADGRLVVTSQAQRDQPKNLDDARLKLALLIARALTPPRPRRPTRPTAGSRERRLQAKQRRAGIKRERRPADD
jgi:ribosome-associated protein